jgi:major vault protein
VFETVVGTVQIKTVNRREWVVIQNPVENGSLQHGKKIIIRGEKNFFLQPGEVLLATNSVHVLTADKALLLQAVKPFEENTAQGRITRKAGEVWILPGPAEYWPTLDVKVVSTLPAILQLGTSSIFRMETVLYCVFAVLAFLYIFLKLISALFF